MHRIANTTDIAAPLARVREAVTTTAGHRAWWTTDCEVGSRPGETATFRFKSHGDAEMTFRIDRVDDHGLAWTCIGGRNTPEWKGTTLEIALEPEADGTRVTLVHDGFRERGEVYDKCTGGWRYFMDSLKAYLETGTGTPHQE